MLGEVIAGLGVLGSGAVAVIGAATRLENRITSGFSKVEAQLIASSAETRLMEQRILQRLDSHEGRIQRLEQRGQLRRRDDCDG